MGKTLLRRIIVHIPSTVIEARPEKIALPMEDWWLDNKAFRGVLKER
jgi:hypothetical protein